MKTYHIKDLLKKDLLIVEAKDEKIAWAIIFQKYGVKAVSGYALLGKPDEISEEDAKELVDKVMNGQHFQNYKGRKENDFANLWCLTAKQSLLSAIETVIFWDVNPFKKPNGEDYYYEERHGFDGVETLWDGGTYHEDLGEFDEAESRTFDRNRTLIFVKQ